MPPRRAPPMAPQGAVSRRAPPPQMDDDEDDFPQSARSMQNFDEGFEGDADNEAFFDDPRDTFTGDQSYNNAVSRAQLAKTYYTKSLTSFIRRSTLFPDTKDTLTNIVSGLFDKTEVLAKTDNIKLEIIDVNIILAQTRIGFHPMDVDNPDLSMINNMILHHYGRYISRSQGGWERGLQNVIETAHTNRNVSEQRPMQVAAGGQKKPWYRRFI